MYTSKSKSAFRKFREFNTPDSRMSIEQTPFEISHISQEEIDENNKEVKRKMEDITKEVQLIRFKPNHQTRAEIAMNTPERDSDMKM